MFYHQNMAVQGLYPGYVSTRSVANLGHFELDVIIEPVKSTGGGYVPVARGEKPDRYRVTIRVSVNGKVFQETYIVDDMRARVFAELHGITKFSDDTVMVSVNNVQVFEESEIKVTVGKVYVKF